MPALLCGSMAYDTIMLFRDRFRNHILPEQIHILNVAFLVPDLRREFGGCAGNIAYNMKLLGDDPIIMATVGADASPYFDRLKSLGISARHVRVVTESYTAQAFITTDLDDNQITAFHPGAMSFSHLNRIAEETNASIGIVSPDGREGMLQHARDVARAGIPFVFDPGQGMPMFSGEELLEFIELADWVTVNDYEARLLEERTGQSVASLARRVCALAVTLGGEGSLVYAGGSLTRVPTIAVSSISDPTGCGDAYRAGLLCGLDRGWDPVQACRLGAVMGGIKIESRGPQNHTPSREDIARRYAEAFGERPW